MRSIYKKVYTAIMITIILSTIGACGKNAPVSETDSQTAGERSMDIISAVEESSTTERGKDASETYQVDADYVKKYMTVIQADEVSGDKYWLVDITSDGVPELFIGNGTLQVYTYNNGALLPMGTITADKIYPSADSAFLGFVQGTDGSFVLTQYQYDGELFTEKILVSTNIESDYKKESAGYLSNTDETTGYSIGDMSPFV